MSVLIVKDLQGEESADSTHHKKQHKPHGHGDL